MWAKESEPTPYTSLLSSSLLERGKTGETGQQSDGASEEGREIE